MSGTPAAAVFVCPAPVQAFRSHLEEHNLISDIIQRYAVFKAGVGFTLRRQVRRRCEDRTSPLVCSGGGGGGARGGWRTPLSTRKSAACPCRASLVPTCTLCPGPVVWTPSVRSMAAICPERCCRCSCSRARGLTTPLALRPPWHTVLR